MNREWTIVDPGSDNLEMRRRRALYRARHRGTKEMDWLLGRFAAARLAQMNEDKLTVFEEFLNLRDDILQQEIMGSGGHLQGDFAVMVAAVRKFNGL